MYGINKKSAMSLLLITLLCLASSSCRGQTVDNSTVRSLDLDSYLGNWYEIARFDHVFERGLSHARASYSLNADGSIAVVNTGLRDGKSKTSKGKAKVTDTEGLLRVSFFGPFYSDYRVMMLADDYSYALVGSGSSKFLWILSRTPVVRGDILDKILTEASDRGYDTDKLIWVEQD